jgi:hypothetical protein
MTFEVVIRGQKDELIEMCKSFLPKEWKLRVLKNTTQLSYFKELLNTEYEWVLNLDEDSFLINPDTVVQIIAFMQRNNIAYSGFLDGGQLEIRAANPISMNPFFNVFNVAEIKKKIDYLGYDKIIEKSHQELINLVNKDDSPIFDKIELGKLSGRYQNCYVESYYPFFYFLYCNFKQWWFDAKYYDKKIDLRPEVREVQDLTTILGFKGKDFVYHTWYARFYNQNVYHTERINRVYNACKDYQQAQYVTFIIQYIYDHPDRYENLQHTLKYLKETCPLSNIIVYELGKEKTLTERDKEGTLYKFKEITETDFWHRTKDFNDIIKSVRNPYICLYDCDVFFDVKDIYDAVKLLKNGCDVVYPYNGKFTNIDRNYLKDGEIKDVGTWHFEMFGGAVFLNRERFIEAGMENENLITYGIDDMERVDRMKILGYKVGRTEGVCYHISHYRGKYSVASEHEDANYRKNEAEWNKIKAMSKEQLQEYVGSWSWCKDLK